MDNKCIFSYFLQTLTLLMHHTILSLTNSNSSCASANQIEKGKKKKKRDYLIKRPFKTQFYKFDFSLIFGFNFNKNVLFIFLQK